LRGVSRAESQWGEEWRALLGRGEVVVAELSFPEGTDTLQGGEQRGEMLGVFLAVSAERGCSLSGLRARRRRGEPAELGSADFGLEKDFLLGVRLESGEKVWVE